MGVDRAVSEVSGEVSFSVTSALPTAAPAWVSSAVTDIGAPTVVAAMRAAICNSPSTSTLVAARVVPPLTNTGSISICHWPSCRGPMVRLGPGGRAIWRKR